MVDLLPEHTERPRKGKRLVQGVYLLPNLFTTAALFMGFYAVVQSLSGNFGVAALAIFGAGLLDGLDGRIARLVNAQSSFGKEYDSLSDIVSFGVAPALMAYMWGLNNLGGAGQAITFAYLICIALRLARYNSLRESGEHVYFSGLASPAAAVLLSSFIWVGTGVPAFSQTLVGHWLMGALTISIAALTVLNIPYRSFKEIDFRGRVPFANIFAIAFIFIAIAINPPTMLLIFSGLYALSGPLNLVRQKGSLILASSLVSALKAAKVITDEPSMDTTPSAKKSKTGDTRKKPKAVDSSNVHTLNAVKQKRSNSADN